MITLMLGSSDFHLTLLLVFYVGYDNPKTLGKYETGSKAALPIFKHFVENALLRKISKNSKFQKIFF